MADIKLSFGFAFSIYSYKIRNGFHNAKDYSEEREYLIPATDTISEVFLVCDSILHALMEDVDKFYYTGEEAYKKFVDEYNLLEYNEIVDIRCIEFAVKNLFSRKDFNEKGKEKEITDSINFADSVKVIGLKDAMYMYALKFMCDSGLVLDDPEISKKILNYVKNMTEERKANTLYPKSFTHNL